MIRAGIPAGPKCAIFAEALTAPAERSPDRQRKRALADQPVPYGRARGGAGFLDLAVRPQVRSKMPAAPMPVPMHIVTMP